MKHQEDHMLFLYASSKWLVIKQLPVGGAWCIFTNILCILPTCSGVTSKGGLRGIWSWISWGENAITWQSTILQVLQPASFLMVGAQLIFDLERTDWHLQALQTPALEAGFLSVSVKYNAQFS